jgi:hypothetical protein
MTAADTTTPKIPIRAGSPAALLAMVPHLLGFTPESSIVIVGLDEASGAVKVTLRYDLPDPADAPLTADITGHATAVLVSQQLTATVAVGYGSGALVTPVADALRAECRRNSIMVGDVLRVEDGRYWSYICTDPGCCPPQGVPCSAPGQRVSAEFARTGSRPLASREALAASVAPAAGPAGESMRRATRRAERFIAELLGRARTSPGRRKPRQVLADQGVAAVIKMTDRYRSGHQFCTRFQAAWLTVVLRNLRVRDDAWARMDPQYRAAHLRLWTDMTRLAQPGYVAAPASLLAFVAWQDGNGALANAALDRALADTPGYSMAGLLRQVITAGAPPSMATLPMSPEEVAAAYSEQDDEPDDSDQHIDEDAEDEPGGKNDQSTEPTLTNMPA